ncbi:MAG: hypothetical protein R3E73_04155 [Porticoccaceae bacterium]
MPFPIVEAVTWHKQPALSSVDVLSPLAVTHAAWAMYTLFSEHQEIDLESEIIDVDYLDRIVGRDIVNKWVAITESFLNTNNE